MVVVSTAARRGDHVQGLAINPWRAARYSKIVFWERMDDEGGVEAR